MPPADDSLPARVNGAAADRRRADARPSLVVLLFVMVGAVASTRAAGPADEEDSGRPPLGYSGPAWVEEKEIEARFASLLDRKRLSATHERLTREAHRAGTPGARRVALYIQQEAQKAGFTAEIVPYLFYNPHPGPRSIEMTVPVKARLSLAEDRIPGDPFTVKAGEEEAYCAYSGSGDAEGEVVYVGQGTVRDFKALDDRGVSLEGRVALMRYFGEGEGRKVLRAQGRGAVAAILYADPAEDGFAQGPVYPDGPWRPPGSIMRRSVADTPYEGDPLTPGRASLPDAKRLDPARVEGLPRIPVLPISYRDASLVLSHLEGPEAPEAMQGGLRRSKGEARIAIPHGLDLIDAYRLGPGPVRVRVSVRMIPATDTIRNVLVRIPGREDPDSWVVLGNHHDAWIYGAGDPSSGTAALLETLRALGRMKSLGWEPRRTLLVAFWDAEEMNLGGSGEWVEDNPDLLRRKLAAVINMDSAVFNGARPLYVGASPSLHRLLREVASVVPAAGGTGSLRDAWLRLQEETRTLRSVDGFDVGDSTRPLKEPRIDDEPLGDDQTPFVEYLAAPASDMYYGADYGVYHSLYENRHWMTTLVDPEFRLHAVMAEFQGRLGLRLVMAPVLPLEPAATAAAWERAFGDLQARAGELQASPKLLRPVGRALKRFSEAARGFARERDETLSTDPWPLRPAPERLSAVSREIAESEKAFWSEAGLPGYPWYRGLWVAPPRAVPGLTDPRLPGLRWPIERDEEGVLLSQVDLYTQALDEATAHLHRAEGLLSVVPRTPPR